MGIGIVNSMIKFSAVAVHNFNVIAYKADYNGKCKSAPGGNYCKGLCTPWDIAFSKYHFLMYLKEVELSKKSVLVLLVSAVAATAAVTYRLATVEFPKRLPSWEFLSARYECKSDADCPSDKYICEAIEGYGTVSPGDELSSYQITRGECKLKEGNRCRSNSQCAAGFLCQAGTCISPIGRDCSGPSDTSCPADYECVQKCGPPVPRGDEPHPGYYCQLKGYQQICPICLASNTRISTPEGGVNVKDIQVGMKIWSLDEKGEKTESTVIRVTKTPVPSTHKVMHLTLSDEREVWVSPNHPAANGKLVGDLKAGGTYDGAGITSAKLVPYWDNATYDILPGTKSGLYWANGILLRSTLSP